MKVLVATQRHELIPLHHRLSREGHDSEVLVWNRRYERAWDGKVKKALRRTDGTLTPEYLAPVVKSAARGEVTVVTDVPRLNEVFSTAQRLLSRPDLALPSPSDQVLFGGWFDGERVQAPHVLVPDWGAWPGGLGSRILGGLTLVRLSSQTTGGSVGVGKLLGGALQTAEGLLKSAGFLGLVQFDVQESVEEGEFKLRGLSAGWPLLHTEAFVAELASLGDVIEGGEPSLGRRFVTVLPITTPPWPNPRQGKGDTHVVGGLTAQQQARTFWFDVQVDTEARLIKTAGLDGLVGVATGASDSAPTLARARALEVAQRIVLPEVQFRPDVGLHVESVLATLEERWGLEVF